MVVSYKHLRIKYTYTNINIWINNTQYYRTLLRAHSVSMPSIMQYMLVYNNNSNRIEFKSRQLANIISKFVYYYIKFLKRYSYFFIFFKQIIDTKRLNKKYNYRYYRGKQIIYTLNLKHFILLIRNKIRIKFKKSRYNLWKLFYSIPNNFWNNATKKRIKSIFWIIFFIKNSTKNKIPKQYLGKNEKTKGNLFFFNYNKISKLVYNIFNKKRIPKKEWLIKKNNEKKKKRKRKFGIFFNSNIYEDTFINITNIKVYNSTLNKIKKLHNNDKHINYISYSFINMYCNLLFYIKLNNINLNLCYLYLSYIYKKRTGNSLICINKSMISNINIKSNANNTFNFSMWYYTFIKEHNIYTYFNINSLFVYKIKFNIKNNYVFTLLNNINNIFFIKKNVESDTNIYVYNKISYIHNNISNNINNFFYKKNYYRKTNFKCLLLKKFSIKNKIHTFTTKYPIYNKIRNKIILLKKNKIINSLKTLNIINNNKSINHNIQNKKYKIKLINKRIFKRTFYNSFKNIITSLFYNYKNKCLVITDNNLNKLFISNYKINYYSMYNFNRYHYINNKYNSNKIKYKIINKLQYKYINKDINYNNINNIKNYKLLINKRDTSTIINNSNYIIQNNIGFDMKIKYNNNLIYLIYFNSNIIYKEILTEYNIRIHNKNNKYDHLFILNKNIIIFINKKKNIGNIINGIYLYTNCFYINNNVNYILQLNSINKYSKLVIIPIFTYTSIYYKLINNL